MHDECDNENSRDHGLATKGRSGQANGTGRYLNASSCLYLYIIVARMEFWNSELRIAFAHKALPKVIPYLQIWSCAVNG